ncbi:hypothetical protein CUT44_12585 [Streptomyces carminius]|uniref:Uncharacterized protein n=1 Tax=Streptomyces carminius TaxID=2665496 RepID=A0A2M8LZY1_9ACTN|nr:hypothetical protein [Streptomyces carminius]PJE97508.1 hypothetical protein CUT44_12585 [Streptomyces carminius]
MRAHRSRHESEDERRRRTAEAAARQTPASGGGTAADAVLALQSQAGNAAVSRMVAEQRNEHGAGHGQEAPVQRSAAASGGPPVVQRMDEDEELVRNPPGPSTRVRGPRRSHKDGRTPNKLTAAEWNSLPAEVRNNTTKERLEIDEDPQTLQEQNPALHYTLGGLSRLTPGVPWAAGRSGVVEGLGRNDPGTAGYWAGQDARDQQMGQAARATRDAYTETPEDRGRRHADVDAKLAGSQDAMGDLRTLLADYEGVAIGVASHSGAEIWKFLTTNMAEIKAAGVNTVYLESIREDSYQAHVDAFLGGGPMPPELQAFVTRYDGSMSLGANGLGSLLTAAKAQGMRVKGLDGRPARRPATAIPANTLFQRAATMNTYADQVVTRDRRRSSAEGRYLMEVGSSHTGMHPGPEEDMQVYGTDFRQGEEFPGVDDLRGIPAVEYRKEKRRKETPGEEGGEEEAVERFRRLPGNS